jgi:hypothetical protein
MHNINLRPQPPTAQHSSTGSGGDEWFLQILVHKVSGADLWTRYSSGDADGRREGQRISADLYFLQRTFTKRIGRTDLSLLVADRGVLAAEAADDPVRMAAAKWNLGHILLAQGEADGAEDVAMRAIDDLQRDTPADDPNAAGIGGALWLVSAVAAVRNNDPWTARDRLREHALPAARATGDTNVMWTVFGPTNVGLHAVSVEMERLPRRCGSPTMSHLGQPQAHHVDFHWLVDVGNAWWRLHQCPSGGSTPKRPGGCLRRQQCWATRSHHAHPNGVVDVGGAWRFGVLHKSNRGRSAERARRLVRRRPSGNLRHITLTPTGWSSWETVGGGFTSTPFATVRPNGLEDVYAINNATQLAHITLTPTGWSTWDEPGSGFLYP